MKICMLNLNEICVINFFVKYNNVKIVKTIFLLCCRLIAQ